MPVLLLESVLPWWLVMPATALAMIAVAGHLIVLHRAPIPASRRRIRTANGFLMLVGIPLLVFALSVSHLHEPEKFVLVWIAALAIFGLVMLLGCLDIANNIRLSSRARAEFVRQAADRMAQDIEHRRGGSAGAGGGAAPSGEAPASGASGAPRRGEPPRDA
ncbi:MAG: hypothetical protein AB7K52_05050 [Phycisphaerales bacterium]